MPRTPGRPPSHRPQETPLPSAAQLRMQIAAATGRSPFDPAVVREARRELRKQIGTDIQQSLQRKLPRQRSTDTERNLQDPLLVVLSTLPTLHGESRFGDRKVFIAPLWQRVHARIRMTLPEFKHWLIEQHRQRRLVLARADFISAMPYDLVHASEAQADGATFHFVVDPSI